MRMTLFVTLITLSGQLVFAQSNPISPGTAANKSVGLSGTTSPTYSGLVAGKRGSTIVPMSITSADALLTSIVSDNVVSTLDSGLLGASTVQGSAGAFLQVVASLGRTTTKVRVHSTSGVYIGMYGGAPASEAFLSGFGPGADYIFPLRVPGGTRISLRSLEATGGTINELLYMEFIE